MGITNKGRFRGDDYNNQEIVDVGSIQLNTDADAADKAVRKSQAETISADAVQSKLVSNSLNASTDTAFTSQSLVSFLGAKQDNISIHASSSALLSIENGTEIKVSQLLINEPFTDEVSATLADYLVANPSNGLEKGDVLFLTSATTNQERSWMHKGTSNGDATDFIKLVTDYNQASIRAMLSAGDTYIGFDQGSGQISLNRGINAGQLGAQTLPADSTQFNVVSGATVEALLIALETFIWQSFVLSQLMVPVWF